MDTTDDRNDGSENTTRDQARNAPREDRVGDAFRRARSATFATMPIVLAGSIAVAAGLTGPVALGHVDQRHSGDDDGHRLHDADATDAMLDTVTTVRTAFAARAEAARAEAARTEAARTEAARAGAARAGSDGANVELVAARVAPATYTVVSGDTVSAIAARYGLSTRDVLGANGLSWNAIIHPGQTLRLAGAGGATSSSAATIVTAAATTASYHVVKGDTASAIAARLGVSTAALLAANALTATSVIYPGQTLAVPGASTAGAGTSGASTTGAGTSAFSPATPPTAAAAASPASTAGAHGYTIATGDTLASIATANGTTVGALLAANGLTYTSTIYAGKTLVIPPTSGVLTNEQRANAETIVRVGRSLGVPNRGLVIALAAAYQESGLRNLDHGDRDSVGLFQQRPSQGWGTEAQLMNTTYAAELFFGGASNPNAGRTKGLLDVANWQSLTVTQAAQAVQYSAYPDAYAQWEASATSWLAGL